ncbi:MAG TPA: phosphoglycerate transporter, partial [Dehalococcoidia bacterium]|nr:phosphoglycerate transporter [Dehalococcoidia bacterium]
MLKLGWMSTGRGPTSLALLQAVCDEIETGKLDATISFVLTNRGPGEAAQSDRFQEFARSKGITVVAESSKAFRSRYSGQDWRTDFDRTMSQRIEHYAVDFIFLAGYMLIVSDFFCTRYLLLNLHPALPGGPTGTWQEVMEELARSGAPRAGAMIHIVTPELDRGPTVSYFSFSLQGEPFAQLRKSGNISALAAAIREQEVRREFPLILSTLRALADGDFVISGQRIYDASGNLLPHGRDLSAV